MVQLSKTRRTSYKCPICISLVAITLFCFIISLLHPSTAEKKLDEANVIAVYSATDSKNDFALANIESGGFFDDVSPGHWNLLKKKVKDIWPNYNKRNPPDKGKRNQNSRFFYEQHYEADFVCQHERRIGKLADGGKWVCDPHRIAKQDSCLVYSIGSNNDFSFEEAVLRDIGSHCEIHTFDYDDYNEGAKKAGVHYHQMGFGLDGVSEDPDMEGSKFKSLKTIVKELGHEGRTIDIFKIDCEGCEWSSYESWFDADVTLKQIQVEVHRTILPVTKNFFDTMYKNNYVVTHKEKNIMFCLKGGGTEVATAVEYAFLKLTPNFFQGINS